MMEVQVYTGDVSHIELKQLHYIVFLETESQGIAKYCRIIGWRQIFESTPKITVI